MTAQLVAGTESAHGAKTAGVRARLALEAGKMVSWEWHIQDDEVRADQGMFEMFGLTPKALTSQDVFDCMHAEDLPRVQAEVEASLAADVDYVTEFRVLLPDGRYRWVGARGAVTARDSAGVPLRMLGINWDKSEQKLQEERLSMMADEMNHRVENAFAIMGALIQIGARTTDEKDRYAERLRSQVQALASAHRLSVEAVRRPDENAVVPVRDIIDAALAAWTARGEDHQVTFAFRADPMVANRQSAALAMMTYELATNAVKYGALSTPEGHLTVSLTEAERGQAVLRWVERTAVPLSESHEDKTGRGFGSILMMHCEKMLRGSLVKTMTSTGLHVEVYFPVVQDAARIAEQALKDMAAATPQCSGAPKGMAAAG